MFEAYHEKKLNTTAKQEFINWSNEYRTFIHRMCLIRDCTEQVRDLFYEKYNKGKFESYTSSIENLIILENFLRKSTNLL